MDKQTTIEWNRAMFKRFKKAYALQTDTDAVFEFEGNQFVVGYAKYLIQYLEGVFKLKS